MTAKALLALVLALLASGCRKPTPRTQYICLLDISASIYPDAVGKEFDAMDKLVERLNRGDSLVIIPISGNARNDVQGHIVRLQLSEQRMAFDSDLVAFRKEAYGEIAEMRVWAVNHPSARTDILGTLLVAQQELTPSRVNDSKLIILSDFLEDDGKWNFATDRTMATPAGARRLAELLNFQLNLSSSSVYLGFIRCRDTQTWSAERLNALDAFWQVIFHRRGRQTIIHLDGVDQLGNILAIGAR